MRTIVCMAAGLTALLALASCSSPLLNEKTVTPIYAATAGGLSVYNGTSWTNYTATDGLGSTTVNGVAVYGSGSTAWIYAATAGGLSYYNGSSWSNYSSTTTGFGTSSVTNAVFLGSTYLYVATAAGLTVNDGTSWSQVTSANGGPATTYQINDVFYSSEPFVATNANGLYTIDANGWKQFTTTDGLPSMQINSVFVDSTGEIYAGTPTGLAGSTDGGSSWQSLLSGRNVHSVFVDPNYNIYVGTSSGLWVYDYYAGTWTNYTTIDGLGSAQVNGVYAVGSSIYAATQGGLSVSTDNGATWKNYTTADGLGSNVVNGVYVTPPVYSY